MKMHMLLVSGVLSLAVAGAALAADTGAPKPSAEQQKLGYFVGKWTSQGEFKPSPMGPGGAFTSKSNCEWFTGKYSVVCKGKGNGPFGTTQALGILGYSGEEKVYTYYGLESGPMTQATVSKGTVDGDTWTYTDESKMGGKLTKSRYVIKIVSPTSYNFNWDMQDDKGAWNTVMTGTETKVSKKKAKN